MESFSRIASAGAIAMILLGSGAVRASDINAKPTGKLSVCFSQVVMNHPFRVSMVKSLRAAAVKDPDVNLTVTDAQGDVTKEIANVESFIARGCNAIIISSLSGKAIYPAYSEVAQAKIPLIIAASGVPDQPNVPYTSYVATDEVSMGERAFDYIADALKGKGNVAVIEGVPESTNSALRREGFNAQTKYWPDIKIVADQSGQWLRLPARQAMANILQANPKIDAVFAQNDEMALGAIQAVQDAGRKNILVVGMDGQKEALEAIKAGTLSATISNEWRMDVALKTAIDAARGKAVPTRVILRVPLIDNYNVEANTDKNSIF